MQQSPVRNFSFRLSPVLFCLLATAGCGASQSEEWLQVNSAHGSVLVKGKPAEGVVVLLQPAPATPAAKLGLSPTGSTGSDGTFTLSTYEQGDGAPAGEYTAIVR